MKTLFVRTLLAVAVGLGSPSPAPGMNLGRAEAGVDQAVARYGVSGKGVLVAVLDRGIDWKNDDFRNADGTTRIKWIFDLTDDTGAHAPGNAYGMGTLYSEAQINAALTGGPPLATRDAVGHGTTTTGILAGNGRGLPSRQYRGVAPESDIIVVKVVAGAPAHDDQPEEADYFSLDRALVGLDFLRDQAAALGRPCVMVPNFGSIGGPTDGTSEWCRKVDALVKPGLLIVNGTGDDGGAANRATGHVPAGGAAAIEIQKGDAGFMRLDLWYPGSDRFDVVISTPGGTFGPFLAPANSSYDYQDQPGLFTLYHQGSSNVYFGATNGKREILIDFRGPVGTYTLELRGSIIAAGGRFDAGLNPATLFQPTDAANRFLTFAYPGNLGNIWDGGSALRDICPGDYVVRTDYVDLDGIARSFTSEGTVGEIWKGSSAGPTHDGRLGIDIAAPGDSLFTTYNTNSYWATARYNLIQDGLGKYGRASAVSAANPFTAGVVALMLQLNPALDPETAKQILRDTARADTFTGAVPNPQWGHGKLDALAALSRVADSLLRITSTRRINNGISISFASVAGKRYRAEYLEDFAATAASAHWLPLPGYTSVAGTGGVLEVLDVGAERGPQRFYRIALLP